MTIRLNRLKSIRLCAFIVLFFCGMTYIARVFAYKGRYIPIVNTFLQEPEDSLDVLTLGSSHMYCSLIPAELYRQFGLRSFNLATQRQPAELTYCFLEMALRRHRPKVVVVETYMFLKDDGHVKVIDGVAHDTLDAVPWGLDRLKMIFSFDHEGEPEDYIIPFIKYHVRWKELVYKDFVTSSKKLRDPLKGYKLLVDAKANKIAPIDLSNYEIWPLHEEYITMLDKIWNLVNKSGSHLVLLAAPFQASSGYYCRARALSQYALEKNIDVLDMNVDFARTRIDGATDFYDGGHLNLFGAEKATRFLGEFIMSRYSLKRPDISETEKASWDAAISSFNEARNEMLKKRKTDKPVQ